MFKIKGPVLKKQKGKITTVRGFVRSGPRSSYITIPTSMVEFLGWTIEDFFKLTAKEGKIIIEKLIIDS